MRENDDSQRMSWDTADENRYEQSIAMKIPGYAHMHDLMERLLAASLMNQPQARLIIVGAGGGKEITLLGNRHPEWSFTGIDLSEPMLQLAARRVAELKLESRVDLRMTSIEAMLEEVMYDGATCMLMLHFIQGLEAKKRLLHSLAAKLKSGAPLVIAAVNADLHAPANATIMNAWREHMLHAGITVDEWERFADSLGQESDPISSEVMIQLLQECGFTDITRYFGSFWVEGYYARRI
ncbi:class I SAM-dependent methyltransferase [Paenibacillus sp. ACRSA]|uniref:class I SAM-dependent methyltransferase n=1 Tax=Paenibacillus sp. ACRSA TaxID=2918211 RepID=UPI001EF6E1E1|nr:class I SAM-dependent methyltransferase [Paenibacillus sp. ACRSA]MCG7376593.1 class I SAM-dependent methyltransferase [Paenibacillus sp. ACRSA]